jgi:hypothetical protein
MGQAKRRREPKHEPETMAAGVHRNGHLAPCATTEIDELIVDRVAHEREMAAPRLGALSTVRLQRLVLDGDAAAAKGARALQEWMDGLTGDEEAHVSIAMQHRWREIVRGVG